MQARHVAESVAPDRPGVARGAGASSAWDALLELLPGLVGNRVVLLQLELKVAAGRTAVAGGLALVALITLAAAWLLANAALVFGLVRAGWTWGWAAALGVLLNVVLGVLAALAARRAVAGIGLPATTRHLTRHPEGTP